MKYFRKKKKKSQLASRNPFFHKNEKKTGSNFLKEALYYLTSSTGYDQKRKHLRGVQLAQRLIGPHITNINMVMQGLSSNLLPDENSSSVISTEDSCKQYTCNNSGETQGGNWEHFASCLIRLSQEESIIDSEVYNYAEISAHSEPDGEDNDPVFLHENSDLETSVPTVVPGSSETKDQLNYENGPSIASSSEPNSIQKSKNHSSENVRKGNLLHKFFSYFSR